MRITITPLILVLLGGHASLSLSADETASADNVSEAFSKAKIKGQLRYRAQHRDSNLRLLQDSSTPDISDESTQ